MGGANGRTRGPIEPTPCAIVPTDVVGRAEGVAFSPRGDLLAVVDSRADRVTILRPGPDGWTTPHVSDRIAAAERGTRYIHDATFSRDGTRLALALRDPGRVTIHVADDRGPGTFRARPKRRLRGAAARLAYTDAVSFVPPGDGWIATANLQRSALTFHRRRRFRRDKYEVAPRFELSGVDSGVQEPDGLAFSPRGDLLAVSNHGADTVTVYARNRRGQPYGPTPIATLGGPNGCLRVPHSLAFSTDGALLAVTNAGAPFVSVFRAPPGGTAWDNGPVQEVPAADTQAFAAVNGENQLEGGPKGIAFAPGFLAVCNNQQGVRIHATRSRGDSGGGIHGPRSGGRWYPL